MADPFAPAHPPSVMLVGMRETLDGKQRPEILRLDGALALLDAFFPAALHAVIVETSRVLDDRGRSLVDLMPNELDERTRLAWLIAESAARTRPTPPRTAGEVGT